MDLVRLGTRFTPFCTLLLILAPLTWQAARVYPVFDDAGFELILKENGAHSVAAALTNRPVVGWILQHAMVIPQHRQLGVALQFVAWGLFGLVAFAVWRRLFPDVAQYAPIAGCLAIAPLLLKAQFGTWLFALPVNFSVLPAFAAGLLLWNYAEKGSRWGVLLLAISGLLTIAGGMLSEYGFLATLTCCIVLAAQAIEPDAPQRTRIWQSIVVLGVSAVGAHAWFTRIAEAHPAYGGVSFTPPVSEIIGQWPVYIVRAWRAFWYATAGAYGQSITDLAGQSMLNRISFFSIVYCVLVAAVLAVACRGTLAKQIPGAGEKEIAAYYAWPRLLAIFMATAAALAPAYLFRPLFVGRELRMEDMSTRYYFVAAPFAIAITLRCALAVLRPARWWVLPVAAGLLCANGVLEHVRESTASLAVAHAIDPLVRPYVEANPGQTVLLTPDFYARDLETTYKASAGWPADLSRRFITLWDARTPIVLDGHAGDRGAGCEEITSIDRNMDTVIRRGPIAQLLWLQPLAKGGYRIEPYCLAAARKD